MSDFTSSLRRAKRNRFATGLAIALIAGATAGSITVAVPAAPAEATEIGAGVTVSWSGGNETAIQSYQPERDTTSRHYGDFDEVDVRVSQTTDLTDQAVTVEVTGMTGATATDLVPDQGYKPIVRNFIQAMQCWGDPLADDFYKNCQFGAWDYAGSGLSNTPLPRLPASGGAGMASSRGTYESNVPFRSVQGTERSSLPLGTANPLQEWFNWQTTNEVVTERVDGSGRAVFGMEMQSSISAPHLGCGNPTSATGTRCWLVVVPRGSHVTASATGCEVEENLRDTTAQVGSPVNPACDYWDNRVVVPLDFRPVTSSCTSGSAERLVAGSELIEAAFTSWQQAVCRTQGTPFALVTSADTTVRQQLLDGRAGMIVANAPLTAQNTGAEVDESTLAEKEIVYAPIAVSGLSIGFKFNSGNTVHERLRLTPRLIAKLVTDSYNQPLGQYQDFPKGPWTALPNRGNEAITRDPEFQELNPIDFGFAQGPTVLIGPNGADAIDLLWQYLQADDDAREFLGGSADPWGMTINPYFLPRGHPDARVPVVNEISYGQGRRLTAETRANGSVVYEEVGLTDGSNPICLCDADLSTFPRADAAQWPQDLFAQRTRYDSTQARPTAENFDAAARFVFRGDDRARTYWDPTVVTPAGDRGEWASAGGYPSEHIAMLGVTDTASAAEWQVKTAALQLPNRHGVFVEPTDQSMARALTAQRATTSDGVTTTDVTALPNDAYPLTLTSYTAVDLPATDASERADFAAFISYAITDGQQAGEGIGQLPAGYAPLSEGQREAAMATVERIRSYVPPPSQDSPLPASAGDSSPPNAAGTAPGSGNADAATRADTQTNTEPASAAAREATTAVTVTSGAAVGAAMMAGIAGLVAAPILLRRRTP